jgi:hypothetical protein
MLVKIVSVRLTTEHPATLAIRRLIVDQLVSHQISSLGISLLEITCSLMLHTVELLNYE